MLDHIRVDGRELRGSPSPAGERVLASLGTRATKDSFRGIPMSQCVYSISVGVLRRGSTSFSVRHFVEVGIPEADWEATRQS